MNVSVLKTNVGPVVLNLPLSDAADAYSRDCNRFPFWVIANAVFVRFVCASERPPSLNHVPLGKHFFNRTSNIWDGLPKLGSRMFDYSAKIATPLDDPSSYFWICFS